MIEITGFDILTMVKLGCFLFFLKRLSRIHDSGHESFNIGFYFEWVVSVSWHKLRFDEIT